MAQATTILLFVIGSLIAANASTSSVPDGMIPPPAGLRSSKCIDFNKRCPTWKKAGYCTSQHKHIRDYMMKNCKQSCRRCKDKNVEEVCEDTSSYCRHGKQVGDCKSASAFTKRFMTKNCKKSCGFCAVKQACYNSVKDELCKKYKKLGYCDRWEYRSYMDNGCKKTCGLCDLSKTYPCGISQVRKRESKPIVAGEEARKGYWPWQVAIIKKGVFSCGGTLVNSRFVVTAAHCLPTKNPSDYKVVLGDFNRMDSEGTEQTIRVRTVIVHPSFVPRKNNDIALLELQKEAVLTAFVTPACLPKVGEEPRVGQSCFITGWGRTHITSETSGLLQKASMSIQSDEVCQSRNRFSTRKFSTGMLCAKNPKDIFTSACHGDSGGPLVCEEGGRMILQGVVSWGSRTCDALDRSTVFTKVSSYISWIKKIAA